MSANRKAPDETLSIWALAEGQTALQLGLTGIPVEQPESIDDAERLLGAFLLQDSGMVIVQESLRERFSERFAERLARHGGMPLIIYCPPFEDEQPATDELIARVLKPVTGYEIRLD